MANHRDITDSESSAILALAKRCNGYEKYKDQIVPGSCILTGLLYKDLWYALLKSEKRHGRDRYICLICGARDKTESCDVVNTQHAIDHLKEYKLVAFL